jgi:hypothetical protein
MGKSDGSIGMDVTLKSFLVVVKQKVGFNLEKTRELMSSLQLIYMIQCIGFLPVINI